MGVDGLSWFVPLYTIIYNYSIQCYKSWCIYYWDSICVYITKVLPESPLNGGSKNWKLSLHAVNSNSNEKHRHRSGPSPGKPKNESEEIQRSVKVSGGCMWVVFSIKSLTVNTFLFQLPSCHSVILQAECPWFVHSPEQHIFWRGSYDHPK